MFQPRSQAPVPDDETILPFDDLHPTRRSFLRLVGYGIAASGLVACSRSPESSIISPLQAPEGFVAGRRYQVATTCAACPAACGILAQCRDGRPIKLEGNPGHPVSSGGLCAVGQAWILELYDAHRFDGPRRTDGAPLSFDDADAALRDVLDGVRNAGGRVRLLTGTCNSPSTLAQIERFRASFRDSKHVSYDVPSAAAVLEAHLLTHGTRVLPRFHFDRADVLASFDADFLATWISPVEFARGWAAGRRLVGEHPTLTRHWQFEARVSPTGSCADVRKRLAPWEVGPAIAALADAVDALAQGRVPSIPLPTPQAASIDALSQELWAARGRSLVVCGQNDVAVQSIVNRINATLGNYGKSLDLERPSFQRTGSDGDLATLRAELDAGAVDVLIVAGCNPAYDLPGDAAASLRKARLLVSLASLADETSAIAHWVVPEPHGLECWNDHQPVGGVVSLSQPALPALRRARTLRESLARWLGDRRTDREIVAAHWDQEVHPHSKDGGSFRRFFRDTLERGWAAIDTPSLPTRAFDPHGARSPDIRPAPADGRLGIVLYPKVGILDGRHAHNPWLQELPDPVSRLAWESYAVLAPATATRLGLAEGDVIRLDAGERYTAIEVPLHVQPGQHESVVALALGYGRAGTDRFAKAGPEWFEGRPTVEPGGRVGVNAAPLQSISDTMLRSDLRSVELVRTERRVDLASVQEYQSLQVPAHLAPADGEVRDAARIVSLASLGLNGQPVSRPTGHQQLSSMWSNDHVAEGPQWGMVIDLSACIGCSACVIACQAENNIPVVGRDEVRRHRDMQWIRIDRYQQGDGDELEVARQPMMCQHCGNAPCEAVCPVLATVHSEDGLNQQVYNRCVGTRYCANTCPYKVRRFNWFDYPREDALANQALNPDVTVRSRGVMEKCSLCVQRVQEGRLEARRNGQPVADGAIQTACEQTCPTRAITFGNLADPESAVSRRARSSQAYRVLEELNVAPRVWYLPLVRNTTGA